MYDSSKWESVKNIFNLCDVPTKPGDI
jgi:lysosomal Pro-X carboxypeptidase